MTSLIIKGTVTSGFGEGRSFLDLEWVKDRIREVSGFTPYPGTLNLFIRDEESGYALEVLREHPGIPIEPQPGYLPGKFFEARVENLDCVIVIVIPALNRKDNVLELASEVNLRETLRLRDGDYLEVEVYL